MEALRLQKKRHTINTKAAYVFHPPTPQLAHKTTYRSIAAQKKAPIRAFSVLFSLKYYL